MSTLFWQRPSKFGTEKPKGIAYQKDYSDNHLSFPGPSTSIHDPRLGQQALADWNRSLDHYHINGLSVRTLNGKAFTDVAELKAFFNLHLFHKVSDENTREKLVKQALNHFHQAGLPHAFNYVIFHRIPHSFEAGSCGVKQPHVKVEFYPTTAGVVLNEVNTFRDIMTTQEDGNIITETAEENNYFARVEARYSFTMDENQKLNVKVQKAVTDIKDPRLTTLFDERNLLEKLMDFIKSLFKDPDIPEVTDSQSLSSC